jgi:hypothetical protein
VHLVEKWSQAFAECRIVVSPRPLRGVACADRETSCRRRRRERCVSEIGEEHTKKVFAAP